MTLAAGTKLGPYEIVAPLGAGGMGEVYRARDTRLAREVAVKVLPQHLSENAEVRARFEREAKTVSSLNHAHICTLYDVGREGGTDYLVMELVEGETLAARLGRGPLGAGEVLKLGVQIADALDRAHRAGIVHRDLKPGNIMLTKSGAKLMDFGLARATGLAGPGSGSGVTVAALTQSPTVAAPLTAEGTIVGTFQYMAPEQLEGKEADARSDLWALGCVLYEMATGTRAFEGKSQASLIGAIMGSEPAPLTRLSPLSPPGLEQVVRACLAKDAEERIQTAHDVKLQLQWIAAGGSQAGVAAPVAARRRGRERLAWALAGVALAAAIALAAAGWMRRPPPPVTMRFLAGVPHTISVLGSPRVSPDGRVVAFDAVDSTGRAQVWLRAINSFDAQPLAGTENAGRVFWSPDSRYLGFFADGKLKKIAIAGGPAQTVCDAPTGSDGSWGRAGVILFDGGPSDPIRRVPAAGGIATVAVPHDSVSLGWPEFLPDGRHFLFNFVGSTQGTNEVMVGALDAKPIRHLGIHGSRTEYSRAGYILYVSETSLMAQPFDAGRSAVAGEPFPVAERVGTGGNGLAHFSVSDNDELVYSGGGAARFRLTWLDRTGKEAGVIGEAADIQDPALSPDGSRIAVRQADPQTGNRDVWVVEPARGTATRFTFEAANDNVPIWSPDGGRLLFTSNRRGHFDLFQKASSGAGADESLLVSPNDKYPSDWSADGRYIAYQEFASQTKLDIMVLPTFGDHKPIPFLASSFNEAQGRFSPDGRWMAYASDESGKNEVYVQAFPGPGGKWQISTQGGSEPFWRADGKELLYLTPDFKLMSVEITPGATFAAGVPRELFQMRAEPNGWTRYTLSRDGQRILVVAPEQNTAPTAVTVVLNWNAEVKRK